MDDFILQWYLWTNLNDWSKRLKDKAKQWRKKRLTHTNTIIVHKNYLNDKRALRPLHVILCQLVCEKKETRLCKCVEFSLVQFLGWFPDGRSQIFVPPRKCPIYYNTSRPTIKPFLTSFMVWLGSVWFEGSTVGLTIFSRICLSFYGNISSKSK